MKKTVFFAAAVLAAFPAFSKAESTGFIPAGNVSSYTKTIYSVTSKFGDYFRSVSEKEVHTFKNGRETEYSLFNAKDELTTKITFSYDGKKIAEMIYSDTATSSELKTTFEYGEDSKLKSETVKDAGGNLDSKTIYKYDGEKCTESYYDKDGKLFMRTIQTIKVGGNGIPEEEIQYNGDGTFALARKYTYSDTGKIAEVKTLDENENCQKKIVFRYDTSDFLTEIQVYNENGKITERRIYKNDSLGNPVRISYYDVAEKFGTTVNELSRIEDFSYSN
ncbi:hypothetical protein [Treponema sp.]|uniref:hypothetical protein n=1 Tax=Treponema sp. TaxID=166 RepID=UPI003F078390